MLLIHKSFGFAKPLHASSARIYACVKEATAGTHKTLALLHKRRGEGGGFQALYGVEQWLSVCDTGGTRSIY